MSTSPEGLDLDTLITTQSALLGLTITPEQRPGVLRYLQLVVGMAPRVMDFALTPADESGNVFVPVVPRDGAGT
jgi:Protein of unknown function (DUF4089)